MALIKFKNGSSMEVLEDVTDIKRSKPKEFMYEYIDINNLYWHQRLYLKLLLFKQKKRRVKLINESKERNKTNI